MVRPVGLEPTLPKKTDFESVASTDSATVAYVIQTFVRFAVTGPGWIRKLNPLFVSYAGSAPAFVIVPLGR